MIVGEKILNSEFALQTSKLKSMKENTYHSSQERYYIKGTQSKIIYSSVGLQCHTNNTKKAFYPQFQKWKERHINANIQFDKQHH